MYECIKDTIGYKKGERYSHISNYQKDLFRGNPEYFKLYNPYGMGMSELYGQIKEDINNTKREPGILPKYKVGDYVVNEQLEGQIKSYIKITDITIISDDRELDNDIMYNSEYDEKQLRRPTKNELITYFR